ncbi:MAG: hypothetical protein V3U87_06050 [Methylococcaceae bacterium]
MTELQHADNQNDQQVLLGDENSQHAISFKLAQVFYDEITGKSEQLSEEFRSSFVLSKENINQLHQSIIESTSKYTIASAIASFSVDYMDNSSERFSSIDRFMMHAGNKVIPVEEVDISYNFLVILPQTQKPQEYRINIRFMSRTSKVENMKQEINDVSISIPLSQFESKYTCRISIDFVDMTVARAFMSVVINWIDSLEVIDLHPAIKYIRSYLKYLPIVCQYGLLAVGVFYSNQQIELFFSNITPSSTSKFILVIFLFNFVLFNLGKYIGYKIEWCLNQLYQLSYINFSAADVQLARDSISSVRSNITVSAGYIVITIILAFISSGVVSFVLR